MAQGTIVQEAQVRIIEVREVNLEIVEQAGVEVVLTLIHLHEAVLIQVETHIVVEVVHAQEVAQHVLHHAHHVQVEAVIVQAEVVIVQAEAHQEAVAHVAEDVKFI